MAQAAPEIATWVETELPELEEIAHLDFRTPTWLPGADAIAIYKGTTGLPTWDNVWQWVKDGYNFVFSGGTPIANPPTWADMKAATDASTKYMIQAMSGFHDRAVKTTLALGWQLSAGIDNQTNAELHDFQQLDTRLTPVEAQTALIVNDALPQLWQGLENTRALNEAQIAEIVPVIQQWTRDNIAMPLLESLGEIHEQLDQKINDTIAAIPQIVKDNIPVAGLATAASVAAVATKVAAVGSWVDDCGEPMCETMGPKTDLGKLLKAVSLLGAAAALGDFATMTEADVLAKLKQAIGEFTRMAGDFNDFFSPGGETVAALVKDTIGSVI